MQCKTGWIEDDCIRFKAYSQTTTDGEVTRSKYSGEIEAFAVYRKDNENPYWVPESETGEINMYMRINEPKIDHPNINIAEEYRFDKNLP